MKNTDLFVYVPAHLLPARLPFLLNRKWQPEVACQEIPLDRLDFGLLGETADQLREHGLRTTLHAPFTNFNPGSPKKRKQKAARKIAAESLQLAAELGARRVVFHPGIPYGAETKVVVQWLKNCLDFWPDFLARAAEIDTIICIENIFEAEPEILVELIATLNSPRLGHVFDIGHWNIFSNRKLSDWLATTAPYLKHLHLHDNHGERDEHLPVGQGYVPFSTLFEWLDKNAVNPTVTLENHNLPDVEISLKALQRFGCLVDPDSLPV